MHRKYCQLKCEVCVQNDAYPDMVNLFQSSKSNFSEHIKHIFEEGELQEEAVVWKFRTNASDGKEYLVNFFNKSEELAILNRLVSGYL